jgi:hypothetical protein
MANAPANKWVSVGVTGIGSVVVQGMILFPSGSEAVTRVVVKAKNGKTKLLPAGARADGGEAAVLPGDLLVALGGRDAIISYRPATWRDVLRYKPIVKVQLLVVSLTLVATVLSAITSFVGTRSPTTPTFTADAAPWVLGIAFLLAMMNLYSNVKSDLS